MADSSTQRVSRRKFLTKTTASATAFTIVPRHVLGGQGHTAPSERVNVAGIGAGGMGASDVKEVAKVGANIVALCDVDDERAASLFAKYDKARRYKDFRECLDKEAKHIDAVTVGTPDHIHAPAAMMAMQMGKHVYCEKPLTHTIHESRMMARAAEKYGVMTQMGNNGHAEEGTRLTNEWIQGGVIGEVREVHVWTDRAGGFWPQGIGRPQGTPPPPSTLAWDLWLGPAPTRPYHPAYVPADWRGFWDFGTGALGDMGCHIIDHPYWALKLGYPTAVESRVTTVGSRLGDEPNLETYPHAAITHFWFPARQGLPPVHMIWYEGGLMPPHPAELPPGDKLPSNGALYIGSKGKLYHSSHGSMPALLPRQLHEEAQTVPKTIPRSDGHWKEWVDACKGGKLPVSNFGYSGPLTEVVLLGNLAMRAPGQRIEWDGPKMKSTNVPELNEFVQKEYRSGWSI